MAPLQKLTIFYISNNRIKNWEEVAKCSQLADLTSVLLIGNPIYTLPSKQENWPMVVRKIPNIQTVDGAMVTAALRAEAEALEWARRTSIDEQMKKGCNDEDEGRKKTCIDEMLGWVAWGSDSLIELLVSDTRPTT